jgi:hypothetical protein
MNRKPAGGNIKPGNQKNVCVWTWWVEVPAGWISAKHGRQDDWYSSSAPRFCPECGSQVEVKPQFMEAPPLLGCADYGRLFQEWWWRKCEYYGLDPLVAFGDMLGLPNITGERLKPHSEVGSPADSGKHQKET